MGFIRDLKSNIDVNHSLAPAVGTGNRTGTGVDLRGYDGALVVAHFGAWTDGTHTVSLEDSSDNTTFASVASSNLLGSFTGVSGTAGNNTVQRVGYIGGNRYIRAFITASASTVVCATAATVVRGLANRQPLS